MGAGSVAATGAARLEGLDQQVPGESRSMPLSSKIVFTFCR
jgi:hypothetical protein